MSSSVPSPRYWRVLYIDEVEERNSEKILESAVADFPIPIVFSVVSSCFYALERVEMTEFDVIMLKTDISFFDPLEFLRILHKIDALSKIILMAPVQKVLSPILRTADGVVNILPAPFSFQALRQVIFETLPTPTTTPFPSSFSSYNGLAPALPQSPSLPTESIFVRQTGHRCDGSCATWTNNMSSKPCEAFGNFQSFSHHPRNLKHSSIAANASVSAYCTAVVCESRSRHQSFDSSYGSDVFMMQVTVPDATSESERFCDAIRYLDPRDAKVCDDDDLNSNIPWECFFNEEPR